MPWEKRFGLPSTRSTQMFFTNVTFAGFAGTEAACGGAAAGATSVAYAHNPTQVDMAVPVFARGVAWDGVAEGARFSFRPTGATKVSGMGAVTVGGGDGFQNILLQDDDGSLTGTPRSSVLGPNPALGEESPTCVWKEAWQGMVCPGVVFRMAIIENMDADRGHRNLGQLFVERLTDTAGALASYGAVNLLNRTALCQGPLDDTCPMRFYFGQYNYLLRTGRVTHIMFSGTEPGQTRYHFFSPYASEGAVLKMYHQRPNSLNVYADATPLLRGGAASTATTPTLPTLSDAHGAWLFNPQARHVTLTVRGSGPNWDAPPINVLRLASVQVTLTLSLSEADWTTGGGDKVVAGMAALLGIPASRIKVVSVQAAEPPVRRRGLLASAAALFRGRAAAAAAIAATIEILPDPTAVRLSNDTSFNATGAPAAGTAGADALAASALASSMASVGASVSNLYATGQMNSVGGYSLLSSPTVLLPPVPTAGGPAPSPAPGVAPGAAAGGDGATKLSAGELAAAVVGGVVAFMGALAIALLAYRQAGLHGHAQTRVRPGKPLTSAPPPGDASPTPLGGPWAAPQPGRGGAPPRALNIALLPSLGTSHTRVFYENPGVGVLQPGRAPARAQQKSARLAPPPAAAARR